MHYLELNNGERMPKLGFGTSQMNDSAFESAIEAALEIGYRHFDAAYQYQNEKCLGKVLKKWLDSGKIKREELFIVTKLPMIGMNPSRVEHFLKLSLQALQLDYADLYLVHWPIAFEYVNDTTVVPFQKDGTILLDKTSNLELIWKAMETQARSGRAKSIGVSNFTINQIERIVKVAEILPVTNQVEMHAYLQQSSLRETCSKYNITTTGFGPLGSPARNNHQYFEGGFRSPKVLEDKMVIQIAEKLNKTSAQILLRYLTQMDISVIPKASSREKLQQNFEIFDFEISDQDMSILGQLDKGEKGRAFTSIPGSEAHPDCPFSNTRQ